MGNHNISPTISKEEIKQFQNSNLIWLDSNVNNSENTIYQNLIKKISQIKFYTFTEINKCIQKLTKINFEKTFVLVSGTLSKKFFTEIEKIKNQLKVIPIIMIFTRKGFYVTKQNILFHDKCILFNPKSIFESFIPIKEALKGQSYVPKNVGSVSYLNIQNSFSFECISSSDQIILPLYFLDFLNIPNRKEIFDFNCFLLDKYNNVPKMKKILNQLLLSIPIPNEILIKYYLSVLEICPQFLEEMNYCLEQQFCFDYDIFMKILYIGLLKNNIKSYKKKIYKATTIKKDQLNYIFNSLNYRNSNLPSCICYNKSFLYLSKNENIFKNKANKNEEYVLFEIEIENNIKEENIFNIDIDNNKVLMFPFSSFEITTIDIINKGQSKYYHINLVYLGKYKSIIYNTEIIPETYFTQDILKTDLLDKFEMSKMPYKFNFNLEKYIPLEAKENYIIAEYDITNNDINKNIRILNCDDSNKIEISQKCQIYVNKLKINFSFQCKFNKPGKYIFKFLFNGLLTNAKNLFYKCDKLVHVSFEKFNTKYITDMSDMFNTCPLLEYLDLSLFKTHEVKSMKNMFFGCISLKDLNLSNFDTINVTDMSGMFSNCISLSYLNLSSINTKNVQNMSGMFFECNSLYYIKMNNFFTNEVVDMSEMFCGCSSLTELKLYGFNTGNVNNMSNMFCNCSKLRLFDLTHFNTSNVVNMEKMFCNCSSINVLDLSNFNTQNVSNMNQLFFNCYSLECLNLSNFDFTRVTKFEKFIYGCYILKFVNIHKIKSLNNYQILEIFKDRNSSCNLLDRDDDNWLSNYVKLIFTSSLGQTFSITEPSNKLFYNILDDISSLYYLDKETISCCLFDGKKLDYNKTIKDYNLENNKKIVMMIQN